VKLMGDGYVDLIERTRREHAEWMAEAHPPVAKMRESSGGLLDLSDAGVPMVDGATFGAPAETAFIEPTAGELRSALVGAGVPMRPTFGERVGRDGAFSRMRLSAAAAETVRALGVKADEMRAAVRTPAAGDEPTEGADQSLVDLSDSGVPLVGEAQKAAGILAESRRPAEPREGELIDLDLREASVTGLPTYGGVPDGKGGTLPEVEYDDGSGYQLVTELYAVIANENDDNGENLENSQITAIADSVLAGHPISAVQYGVLKKLAAKYADELAALRASDDDSQNYLNVPDPASGRLVAVPEGSDTADAAAGRVAA
jgi:hypothetical protein